MEDAREPQKLENKSGWLIAGGVLAALVASICCVGPLILTILGISGAAVLAKFEFLRMPMLLVVGLAFGIAGYSLFKKRNSCEPGSICADPKKFRLLIILYIIGLVVALALASSPTWLVWMFN